MADGQSREFKRLDFETAWLQGYARTYYPCDGLFAFCPDDLRKASVSLIDVRALFSLGDVVYADKLDGPGARWEVVGIYEGEWRLRCCVTVMSEEYRVTLEWIKREDRERTDADDAA